MLGFPFLASRVFSAPVNFLQVICLKPKVMKAHVKQRESHSEDSNFARLLDQTAWNIRKHESNLNATRSYDSIHDES